MMGKKGGAQPGSGRPKGQPNKTTIAMREALLAPFNRESFVKWATDNADLYYTKVVMPLQPKDLNVRIIRSWGDLTNEERESLLREAQDMVTGEIE